MRSAAASFVCLILVLAGCGGGQDAGTQDRGEAPRQETSEEAPEATAAGSPDGEQNGSAVRRVLEIRTSGGELVGVHIEVADDDIERARGLMNRRSLPEDAGMLFVFNNEQTRSFWMRDTYIPLSIAYADSEGRIVDIQDMEPLDDEPPSYVSAEPAQYALEVNRGFFDENGVEVGDRMRIPQRLR